MPLDCASPGSSSRAAQLIGSWRHVPAFIVDRHLTVLAANPLLRRLFPGCDPGTNILRHAFQGDLPWFTPAQLARIKRIVTATLRESLDRTGPDDVFVELVGELAAEDDDFGVSWADDVAADTDGIVVLHDAEAGIIQLIWQIFDVPGSSGDRLCVWGTADTASADALAEIASRP
ncbi:MmyB family transcriptional regulator [Microbacterium caowuchunii]|uniref:MmyB-like transcription regulator ligand binding domain-containing protein n=1 Tax=Microbacterium caowuchunii TaxID=2614638 RepID=A0A5N0TP89_9MICO|nr:hypothetical protein [Microbacterium caowuchunii]KAA9136134.1 hypothetical protein F6B40_00300 [Microbacterium caowuchunii]